MKFKALNIDGLVAKYPIVQGGMGIGISLSNLAGHVALAGGVGVISTAQIGYDEENFEKEFEMDFGEEYKLICQGYRIATALKSKNTLLFVKLELNSLTPPVYPEVNGTVRINGDWGDSNVEPITTVKEDFVYIDNGDMHCTLSKNIGIVQVSGKGHTWTLKQ